MGDYIQQHQWQKAIDYLERALADPAVERKARLDLAKAEAELGQSAAAIRDLSRLAADDRDGEIHYRLAMLYRKTGETPKAQEALASSEALRKASDQLDRQKLEALDVRAGIFRISTPQCQSEVELGNLVMRRDVRSSPQAKSARHRMKHRFYG